jgi:hypothetical protein
MKMIEDDAEWAKAWMDTPLGPPTNPATPTDAMKTPGCAVKTKTTKDGWPTDMGIVVSYADEKVVVRSHNDKHSPKRVWTGTTREYFDMWECD